VQLAPTFARDDGGPKLDAGPPMLDAGVGDGGDIDDGGVDGG